MQFNKTIIAVGIMSLNLLLAALPMQAQDSKQSSKCTTTIQSVKNKITEGRKVSIAKVSKDNISQEYQSYPKNRPFGYHFVLRGAATESVSDSKKQTVYGEYQLFESNTGEISTELKKCLNSKGFFLIPVPGSG
jgi:hypothetical protein